MKRCLTGSQKTRTMVSFGIKLLFTSVPQHTHTHTHTQNETMDIILDVMGISLIKKYQLYSQRMK